MMMKSYSHSKARTPPHSHIWGDSESSDGGETRAILTGAWVLSTRGSDGLAAGAGDYPRRCYIYMNG